MVPRCAVCDGKVDPYCGGARCERCERPCPTCGGDVANCVHELPCEHHAVRQDGALRCSKCSASYVIDVLGARWVDAPPRKQRRAA